MDKATVKTIMDMVMKTLDDEMDFVKSNIADEYDEGVYAGIGEAKEELEKMFKRITK